MAHQECHPGDVRHLTELQLKAAIVAEAPEKESGPLDIGRRTGVSLCLWVIDELSAVKPFVTCEADFRAWAECSAIDFERLREPVERR